jgi:membrane protein
MGPLPELPTAMRERAIGLAGFARFILRRFSEHRCLQVAGSLTFTTLLALVPLVTITVTVVAAFPVFIQFSASLKEFILAYLVPEAAARVITIYMQQFADNAARLTVLGTVLLATTAIMLMMTIDRELNAIWRVSRPRPWLHQVLLYWAVLTVGPLLIGASISLSSWLAEVSTVVINQIPAVGVVLLRATPLVLSTAAFAALFVAVPNRPVPWRHALLGGLISGIAFQIMQHGFAVYVENVPTLKLVYGTFASIPIFLIWIYSSWLVVLVGAVIAASLPYWEGAQWQQPKTPGQPFFTALRLLQLLWEAQKTGEALRTATLKTRLKLPAEDVDQILERLSRVGWVRQLARGGFALVRDPRTIRLADVYRLFVINPRIAEDDPLAPFAASLGDAIDRQLEASLDAFFAGKALRPAAPVSLPRRGS